MWFTSPRHWPGAPGFSSHPFTWARQHRYTLPFIPPYFKRQSFVVRVCTFTTPLCFQSKSKCVQACRRLLRNIRGHSSAHKTVPTLRVWPSTSSNQTRSQRSSKTRYKLPTFRPLRTLPDFTHLHLDPSLLYRTPK